MTQQTRDWREYKQRIEDLLKRRTGDDLETWNSRVIETRLNDEASLRAWLAEQGLAGYSQWLLVMERFGYPAFLTATADELVDAQYADRPDLRAIYEAILARTATLGEVTIQTRKTYVSLVGPRRTFAVVQATTRKRVDLGLRLANQQPVGRLQSGTSMANGNFSVRFGLTSVDEVEFWLRQAYQENA